MHKALSLSVEKIIFLLPALAYAHGDDNVTAASFLGPVVAIIVFAVLVSLSKAFLRMIVKRP